MSRRTSLPSLRKMDSQRSNVAPNLVERKNSAPRTVVFVESNNNLYITKTTYLKSECANRALRLAISYLQMSSSAS